MNEYEKEIALSSYNLLKKQIKNAEVDGDKYKSLRQTLIFAAEEFPIKVIIELGKKLLELQKEYLKTEGIEVE